jgi:SAM-dependent MidA family methyltransferase
MELALYHENLGYYASDAQRIGREGDYYTSPSRSRLFGQLLARQLKEMWQLAGQGPFSIIEFGAGDGTLSLDILDEIAHWETMYRSTRYLLIERGGAARKNPGLSLHRNLVCSDSLEDAKLDPGCILSNELLDNFAVHRVVMQKELMEVYVDFADGFAEQLRPAPPALREYLLELGVRLPPGFQTEINLDAIEWLRRVSQFLRRGFLLTVDYGFLSEEFYQPAHRNGTLLCYRKHEINDSPYSNIGQQDICAHVNFSALRHWGTKWGLDCCGYTNQSCFLRGLGLAEKLREIERGPKGTNGDREADREGLQALLLGMGPAFKVLIQQKGMDHPLLAGLQFAFGN